MNQHMQKTIRRELEHLMGQPMTSHACHAIKDRLLSLMGHGDNMVYNLLDVHVGASKADPTMMIITPMNVLTGMHMLGVYYPPYKIPELLGKYYEDETGVYESSTDDNGDPCFTFTPSRALSVVSLEVSVARDNPDGEWAGWN